MSQNNITNPNTFQPMRQPIHFYANRRNSMYDMYHGMLNNGSLISPNKYFSSKISPIKHQSTTIQKHSPQKQINFHRVINSSYTQKYAKLTAKIQMLQKNLNRLNSQHQSLLSMFQRSDQLAKIGNIFLTLDLLKERLQQSKRNRHIEQKRYEARHEVVYEDWMRRFDELGEESLRSQKLKITQIQLRNKALCKNSEKVDIYDTLYSFSIQHIEDLNVNAQRYMGQIDISLKKQGNQMIQKFKIEQRIKQEQNKIWQKRERVNLKLGEVKCMAEYEMFLAKEFQLNQEINKLKMEFQTCKKMKQQVKESKMNDLQLRFTKEELRFVTVESLDRIMFELVSIDSRFIKVIQQYETKNHKIGKKQKHKLNPTKSLSFNPKIDEKESLKLQKIPNELRKIKYELLGLNKYFQKSMQKVTKIETDCQFQSTQNDQLQRQEFLQSIKELEEKINTLDSNLTFFKSNCNTL